jgi:glucosamine--fructose-6-phosphate aminotransferase (isomerizing)
LNSIRDKEVCVAIDDDILSTPGVLRQTLAKVEADRTSGDLLSGEVLFLGSGSSYCIGQSAASLYEATRGAPAQAMLPSEYRPRPGWAHVAVSRTGQTTELIRAMRTARGSGARVLLVVGDRESPAEEWADVVIALPFASEQGVVQTRFISCALLTLRALITGQDLSSLPDAVEAGLSFQPTGLNQPHVVFLGRGWRYGLARSAALTLEESAAQVPESHQTLDYRHGPIACADAETLVWCFDPPDDEAASGVLRDVVAAGASVRQTGEDPLVSLVQAQLFAARRAAARGIDPDAPPNLTRAVVLPNG